MPHYDICCIGHITKDKVVTPRHTVYMPGGPSFYFSHGIRPFLQDINYLLITSVEKEQMSVVQSLSQQGIEVAAKEVPHSVFFENIYDDNPDNREQQVLTKSTPFDFSQVAHVDATYFHLGALLADDFPMEMLQKLAQKGLVSVDAQGYLREVQNKKVCAIDWKDKKEALKHIHTLKVNEHEMEVLTNSTNVEQAAKQLHQWGVQEVLLTFGKWGSVIYDGKTFYSIPAYVPREVVDPTGCGDTYTIGYLYQRSQGASIQYAGEFAAAMATMKIQKSGPFEGSKEDVEQVMNTAPKTFLQQ